MIVFDASAVVLGLLNDGAARDKLSTESVAVPHLADSEVIHALRGQLLREAITEAQASAAVAVWSRLGVRRFAVVGLVDRIWDLRGSLSGYDATYAALAEALGGQLVTADSRLARAPGPTCPVTVVRG